MKVKYRVPRNLMILTLATLVWSPKAAQSQAPGPVYVEILGDQERNSSFPLEPFDIRFIVHANGNKIQGMVFAGLFEFSNGNIIGTIDEHPNGEAQIVYSAQTISTFVSRAWNSGYGQGTDPDTILLGLTSFSSPWKGTGEMFRIHVTPKDTGRIHYDSLQGPIPPSSQGGIAALDPQGASLPVVVVHSPIHVPPQPGPVRFRILTSSGTDTLFLGVPGTIYFDVDAMGNEISGLVYVLLWEFSNGNIVGHISDSSGEVAFSLQAMEDFESIALSPAYGQGTDPDYTLLGLTSFDSEFYTGTGWIWSVTFSPSDTGTIDVRPFNPGLANVTDAFDQDGMSLPLNFIPGRIVVLPCPFTMMGDVNQDAVLNSSDLIYFVNYIFKSGPDPLPERSVGDVNCSGGLGASDIIYLVNHIFKSGAPPCACTIRRI